MILDTVVNEYSAFIIKDNYLVLLDTNVNLAEGIVGDTNNQVFPEIYKFENSDFVSKNFNADSLLEKDKKYNVQLNLNGYSYKSDSLPKEIYSQFKDSITDYSTTRRFNNFTAFVSNLNILHVYNSKNKKHLAMEQEYISIPLIQEIFFYDFDKDSIPELFIFFHFYMMNHNLISVKCYKMNGIN